MKNQTVKIVSIIIITISFLIIGFSSGVIIGTVAERNTTNLVGDIDNLPSELELKDFPIALSQIRYGDDGPDASEQSDSEPMNMDLFWEAYQILDDYFVDQPLDNNALLEGAIRGMISAVGDPHTRYSDAASHQEELEYMSGEEYEGIGAWVDLSGDYVKITSPMRGSPAEAAGLRARDLIIAIDGEDQTGIDLNVSLSKIKGLEGTKVVLTVKRGSEEPFDVTITRTRLTTPMVTWEMREDGIAYIELIQFGELTVTELEKALDELLPQKPIGLILDLRNNGGGYVDTCVSVAGEFLPKGSLVLTEQSGDGSSTLYKTRFTGVAQDIPMVVLGNEGTASASEILIGALQHFERAIFVGTKTYGKDTMQISPELSNGGAVTVTIARWLTSSGASIHEVGITPDIFVDRTDDDYREGKDPQYDKAVELLLNGVRPGDVQPIEDEETIEVSTGDENL